MLELGMYCRTYKGIAKVIDNVKRENNLIGLKEDRFILDNGVELFYQWYWGEKEKEKKEWLERLCPHSKNITDLIEVGDYVNGYKITEIKLNIENINIQTKKKYYYNLLYSDERAIQEHQIKEILTHEQYENNCYRVERK